MSELVDIITIWTHKPEHVCFGAINIDFTIVHWPWLCCTYRSAISRQRLEFRTFSKKIVLCFRSESFNDLATALKKVTNALDEKCIFHKNVCETDSPLS